MRKFNNKKLNQSVSIKLEAMLADTPQDRPAYPAKSVDELLQDLRIHQIELEMQNEELRRAHMDLEASRDCYQQLYDFAPVAYLSLSAQGLITEANLTCATLLGVERNKLINSRFARYVSTEDTDLWYRYFLHAKKHDGKHRFELLLHRADGTNFHAQLDCLNSEENGSRPDLRIALSDITESKRVEIALHIATAFETTIGIIVTDADKIIISINQAFSRITGYCAEDALGRTPSFLRSGEHDEDFYREMWARAAYDSYWEGEIWDKRKNGEIFPLWLTMSVITDEHGQPTHYVGSFRDITAQKQSEKVLLDTVRRVENKAANSQEALEQIKEESTTINAALKVLLKHRETDKTEAQNLLSNEIEGAILPFLKKLGKVNTDPWQCRLINILENNLQQMVATYGCATNLNAIYRKLSPVEVQVASMVKQGLPTKIIADTLRLSPGTICIHRKHIRKKLGLNSKADNLRRYLLSFAE